MLNDQQPAVVYQLHKNTLVKDILKDDEIALVKVDKEFPSDITKAEQLDNQKTISELCINKFTILKYVVLKVFVTFDC